MPSWSSLIITSYHTSWRRACRAAFFIMQSRCRSLHFSTGTVQFRTQLVHLKSLCPENVAARARQRSWPAHQQQQFDQLAHEGHCRQPRRKAAVAVGSLGRRSVLGSMAPCCCCDSCRISWYDSYFAFNMAHGMQEYEQAIAPLKRALFHQLLSRCCSGPISMLEVGVGAGPNFAYYVAAEQQQQQQLSITGVEPNTAMWQYARQAADAAGLDPQQLQLVSADVGQMPFEQDTFDTAVITLVLCSLPDPGQALSEVLRVLKPGGRLLLIEHVISPSFGWLQAQQRLLDPLQQLLADRCHLTRDTAAVLQRSGFAGETLEPCSVGSVAAAAEEVAHGSSGVLRFEVQGMGLIAPHIAGIITKPTVPIANVS